MTIFSRFLPSLLLLAAACGSTIEEERPVSGTVVDRAGAPVVFTHVKIGDSVTNTDTAGHFTVNDVPGTYDVAIGGSTLTIPNVYLGMSTRTPLFRVFGIVNPTGIESATVKVTLPSADTATLQSIVFLDLLPDDLAWGEYTHVRTSDPWQVQWRDAPAVTARFYAFQAQLDAGRNIVHYVGFDTIDLNLSDGSTATWNVSWKPPTFAEKTVTAPASGPSGAIAWQATLFMHLGPHGEGILTTQSGASPSFSFVVPDLDGARFAISPHSEDEDGSSVGAVIPGLTAGTTSPLFHIDPAPDLIAPAIGAVITPGAPLRWTSNANTATFFQLATEPYVFIFGGQDVDATFPDLGPLGVELSPGAAAVAVAQEGLATTVDQIAAQGFGALFADQPFSSGDSPFHDVTIP